VPIVPHISTSFAIVSSPTSCEGLAPLFLLNPILTSPFTPTECAHAASHKFRSLTRTHPSLCTTVLPTLPYNIIRHVLLDPPQALAQDVRVAPQHSFNIADRNLDPCLRPPPSWQGVDGAVGHWQLPSALGRCYWRPRVRIWRTRAPKHDWRVLDQAKARTAGRHV
jgi:hypothetical protein